MLKLSPLIFTLEILAGLHFEFSPLGTRWPRQTYRVLFILCKLLKKHVKRIYYENSEHI